MSIMRFSIEKIGIVEPEKLECLVCHMTAMKLTHVDVNKGTGNLIQTVYTCECGAVITIKDQEDET